MNDSDVPAWHATTTGHWLRLNTGPRRRQVPGRHPPRASTARPRPLHPPQTCEADNSAGAGAVGARVAPGCQAHSKHCQTRRQLQRQSPGPHPRAAHGGQPTSARKASPAGAQSEQRFSFRRVLRQPTQQGVCLEPRAALYDPLPSPHELPLRTPTHRNCAAHHRPSPVLTRAK